MNPEISNGQVSVQFYRVGSGTGHIFSSLSSFGITSLTKTRRRDNEAGVHGIDFLYFLHLVSPPMGGGPLMILAIMILLFRQ